jgi:F-type H+-transporting ATPase subunit alpha
MNLNEDILQNTLDQMEIPEKNIGTVIASMDGYIIIDGLYDVYMGEKVIINSTSFGLVFDILEDRVIIFTIDKNPVPIGSKVQRTHELYSIDVSENMVGHIFDVLGNCIDGKSFEKTNPKKMFIEREIPNITERESINSPLETGFLLIDTLIPIGKGQRQLFIGNQNTGKTYTAINSFIRNKKDPNAIFIYVAISQQKAKTAKLVEYLQINNALDKSIIISADSSESALNHYLAPYVGCAIAEFFAHELKKDVIIVYDDLSNQAIAYRELCLLMRRAPSREAYPGDIFYLHARLLERAGNFIGRGSITALPIAQLQEDDCSAYIPTNLISITDGQIIFDTKLFNKGIKPAINTELSVSRVGSAAQYQTISKISKSLRLELAQYHELDLFSQFTTDLDEDTIKKLERGKLLISLLKQDLAKNYDSCQKYIILYIFKYHDSLILKIKDRESFLYWIFDFFKYTYVHLYKKLSHGLILNTEELKEFDDFITNIFSFYENI